MLPQKKPQGGKRKLRGWGFDRVEPGSVWQGWIAGPTLWTTVHRIRVSKPCVKEYLGPDAKCEGCAKGKPVETTGYVPVWREGAMRVFVAVPEYMADDISRIRLHCAVRVRRSTAIGSPVVIDPLPRSPRFAPANEEQSRPQDVTPGVLSVWCVDEITAAFGGEEGAVTMPEPAQLAEPVDVPDVPEIGRRAPDRKESAEDLRQTMDRMRKRWADPKPSVNGSAREVSDD